MVPIFDANYEDWKPGDILVWSDDYCGDAVRLESIDEHERVTWYEWSALPPEKHSCMTRATNMLRVTQNTSMTDEELTRLVHSVALAVARRHYKKVEQPLTPLQLKALYMVAYGDCVLALVRAVGEARFLQIDGISEEIVQAFKIAGYQEK